ncbi:MAG: PKD domain-containing protein [Bacteroidota bacterium]
MYTHLRKLLFLFIISPFCLYAQCGPTTPTFTVNLTGNPSGTWLSPNVTRSDQCCGQNGVTCIKFIITLDPAAAGISFNIASGAVPSGALYYQINCGPPTVLGMPICLSGVGPHILTFCKPGNNANTYEIVSIPAAVGGADVVINDGCTKNISATGFNPSTVTWTSIFPGATGAYNNYLSCTSGCLSPTVTAIGTPPAYVDYLVCGMPASNCNFTTVCDTIRVRFNPTLAVNIIPLNPTICFGQTSTTLTAQGSGGTPPYAYLWNNVNPSQTINVGVGTYNVKLSDASGCPPVFNSVTVTAFSVAITANSGQDQIKCIQNPLATLNGTVTGASGGIWSGGNGVYSPNTITLSNITYSPTASELANGFVNLYLTTTGNGTCPSRIDTVKITYAGFTGVATPSITNVSCFGGSNGSATMNLSGGYTPYSYLWNTASTQTTSTLNNLPIGTYSVIIHDGIGCTYQTSVTITQPPVLAVNATIANVSCFGTSTGTIGLIAIGGTAPYTYSWSPGGQTTSSVTGLPAGNYPVTVTDANNCQKTYTYTVTQPLPLSIAFTSTNVSCFNGSNGVASASVTGGTASYTYSWSPGGATSQNVTGLQTGNYTLTVTDNLNCIATGTIAITQPPVLSISTAAINETCNYLNNGSASVSQSGGTPAYTYSWMPGGQTTASISNQASGTYSVTVTDSKGCTTSTLAIINEPSPLTVSFVNQVNVSCFGGNSGSIGASPAGGTPNYTYSWSPGGTTNATLANIPIGTYTVSVTDNQSCVTTNTVLITQPTNIITTSTITNVSCNGGSNGTISISPGGGIPPYTYLWAVGGQTISSVTGLPAGNYPVTVTDANNCQKTYTYTVTQPLPLSIAFTSTNVSCFNGSNGVASASVTGGTASYTYSWSPGGATSQNVTGLQTGNYTLTVTDNLNCIATGTIAITQPPVLSISTAAINETCNYLNNGSASVSQSGGTPAYTYSWMPGGQTTASISNQASGTYSVTVTDSKGCTTSTLAIINEPSPLTVSFVNQVNVSCFGGNSGSIGASPAGGTPNYTYSWSPGGATTGSVFNISAGTYSITIRDNNNCIVSNSIAITQPTAALNVVTSSTPTSCFGGSNGSASALANGGTATYTYSWMPGLVNSQTISGIGSGTYTVTAKDIMGCMVSNTVFVNQPSPILPVTTSTNSTCGNPNGIGAVSATGGVGPYTYQWLPAGGTNSVTTAVIAGVYSVNVTDANNCSQIQLLSINDTGGPNASIFSTTNVSCFGGSNGSAVANIIGGMPPLTYTWFPSGGNTSTATGLTAGIYYIIVEDNNHCVSSAITSPQISQPPALSETINTSNVSCFAGSNGSATVTPGGGTPGYSLAWLPGTATGSVTTGLSAGTYSIQITDANNCVRTTTYSIIQPAADLSVAVSSSSVSCFSGGNGTVNANGSGGTAPYNYHWMPGNFNSQSISNLTAGVYSVTLTDSKNCSKSATVTVIEPAPIVLTTSAVNSDCGAANGQASVTATGGNGSYSYLWAPAGGTNPNAMGLLAGTYSIQVTDLNSCVANAIQSVGDNPGPTVSIVSTTSISCYGGSNGTATAGVAGGTGPFTYTWSPSGGNNPTATGLTIGSYTVSITAGNGCLTSATSPFITQASSVFGSIATSNVSCFAGSNGSATVTPGGGTPGYTYLWLPGLTTGPVVNGLSAGNYSVQITDAHNCIQTVLYSISQPTTALTAMASSSAASCFGGNNGTATVTPAGGTAPYNYNWLPMNVNNPVIGGLSTGVYSVNITDVKNCITSTTVLVSQPLQPLSATANSVPTSCSGGSNGTATVTPAGGTAGYTYQWTPTGGSGQTAAGLAQGSYIVLVKDANNCQTNVSIIVSSPTPVTATLAVINPACGLANGSITSQVSGGIGPYTYTWSPGNSNNPAIGSLLPGIYTFNTSDSFGCIKTLTTSLVNINGAQPSLVSTSNVLCSGGNNGAATITISQGTLPYTINWQPFGGNAVTANQLTAGIYTANVTDGRGCLSTITATVTEPNPVSVSINTIVNVSCFNGNNGLITVTASGGTPGYTYSWNTSGTGQTINNLSAGNYTVTVTDSHFCPKSISMNVSQPTLLTSTITGVTNPLCFNGTGNASVLVAGGTAPYTYTWTSNPSQSGSTATGLGSGTYNVFIKDANGCTNTRSVTLTQPAQIITTAGLNDTICINQAGLVTATATGGQGNYYYAWQPLGVINSGTLNINPATVTTNYTVVAYDQNGCPGTSDTVRAVVYSLNAANINAIAYSPICPGQGTTIYATTTGITGPLTYSWNNNLGNGPGAFVVIPAQPTTYIVTVTNSCGASITDSVRVLFNPPPTVSVVSNGALVCVPGSINFFDNSVSGNSNDPITNWSWNFGDGNTSSSPNPSHYYNTPGTYSVSVTVTTNGGCTNNNASSPFVVNAYPYPNAAFTVNSTLLNIPYDVLSCHNQSTGAVSYNWNFGDGGTSTLTDPTHSYVSVGSFEIQLIATSPHGCTDTAYVSVITDADVVFPNAFTPNASGANGGYYIPGSLDNDIFFPYTSGVVEYKFQTFNRWGELIFETEDIKQGWDGYYRGKICQVGVYIWKAYVKLNNGKVFNKTGDVTLLR